MRTTGMLIVVPLLGVGRVATSQDETDRLHAIDRANKAVRSRAAAVTLKMLFNSVKYATATAEEVVEGSAIVPVTDPVTLREAVNKATRQEALECLRRIFGPPPK